MNLSLAVGVLSNRRKGVFEAIDHKELKLQGVARNKRFGRKRREDANTGEVAP